MKNPNQPNYTKRRLLAAGAAVATLGAGIGVVSHFAADSNDSGPKVTCEYTVEPGDSLNKIVSKLHSDPSEIVKITDSNGKSINGRPVDVGEGPQGPQTPQLHPGDLAVLENVQINFCQDPNERIVK